MPVCAHCEAQTAIHPSRSTPRELPPAPAMTRWGVPKAGKAPGKVQQCCCLVVVTSASGFQPEFAWGHGAAGSPRMAKGREDTTPSLRARVRTCALSCETSLRTLLLRVLRGPAPTQHAHTAVRPSQGMWYPQIMGGHCGQAHTVHTSGGAHDCQCCGVLDWVLAEETENDSGGAAKRCISPGCSSTLA